MKLFKLPKKALGVIGGLGGLLVGGIVKSFVPMDTIITITSVFVVLLFGSLGYIIYMISKINKKL